MPTDNRTPRTSDGTDDAAGSGLAQWLRGRTDDELARLMRLRPDLTIAAPASTAVLASRAAQRMSVHRAAGSLDTMAMAVLAVLVLYDADADPVPAADVHTALAARAPASDVDGGVARLRDLAVVWGDDQLRIPGAAREILPWSAELIVAPPHAAGAGSEGSDDPEGSEGSQGDRLRARIGALSDDERALVDALVSGGGLGSTRDAADDAPSDRPVQRLLRTGLLTKVDEGTVRLPEDVRAAAAGTPFADEVRLTEPAVHGTVRDPGDVDSTAATEVIELLRHAAALIGALGQHPVGELRGGGVGVREIRRLAKQLGLEARRTGFLLEVLARADLIRSGAPEPLPIADTADAYWAPADSVDTWLAHDPPRRWATLARAWLGMPRRVWEIGTRDDADKVVPALAGDLTSPAVAHDRSAVLDRLADLEPGTAAGADELVASLRWLRPRRHARLPVGLVDHLLGEAREMGVVARGALSGPGRALLTEAGAAAGGDGPAAVGASVPAGPTATAPVDAATAPTDAAPGRPVKDPVAAMTAAMPEPVEHVLLQADLTMIAPGPLVPELAERIARVAAVESAGAATVYRVTEDSLRGGLDSGLSRTELHELFASASRTPVPQALTYLIDDVARKHGQLRVGYATSFLRCEDPTILAEVLTRLPDLQLRRIAPTVAISEMDLVDLVDALREAGLPAVGEDSRGDVVDLRSRGARVPAPRRVRSNTRRPEPTALDDEQLAEVVAGMRAGDRAADDSGQNTVRPDGTRASGAATVSLLQTATRVGRAVSVDYVDSNGTAVQRIVEPVAFSGGVLEAVDPVTGARHTFSLHRITSVSLMH